MSEIKVGSKAPAFTTAAVGGKYDGQSVSLADLRGKTVVLYFYPKASGRMKKSKCMFQKVKPEEHAAKVLAVL